MQRKGTKTVSDERCKSVSTFDRFAALSDQAPLTTYDRPPVRKRNTAKVFLSSPDTLQVLHALRLPCSHTTKLMQTAGLSGPSHQHTPKCCESFCEPNVRWLSQNVLRLHIFVLLEGGRVIRAE